jgi:hypothetical protein
MAIPTDSQSSASVSAHPLGNGTCPRPRPLLPLSIHTSPSFVVCPMYGIHIGLLCVQRGEPVLECAMMLCGIALDSGQ